MIIQFTLMAYLHLYLRLYNMKYCNNINGLENVKVIRPGYAIEYDYIDPESYF